MESARYGKNKRAVADSIAQHEEQARQIQTYGRTVDQTKGVSVGNAGRGRYRGVLGSRPPYLLLAHIYVDMKMTSQLTFK